MDAFVLAMNPASVKAHDNYCDKKGFGFPILSDPDRKTIAAFGALKGDGKGVQRSVFALDKQGKVIFAEQGMADLADVMKAIKESS